MVQRLESGGAPLDESLALWERGEQLAAICQSWLDGAQRPHRGRPRPLPPITGPATDPRHT